MFIPVQQIDVVLRHTDHVVTAEWWNCLATESIPRRSSFIDFQLFSFCLRDTDIFYRASAWLAMQSPVLATVELSVCLSGTRWYCVKKKQAKITKSSPTDSPRTLALEVKSSCRNSKGFTAGEGVKWVGYGKVRNFQPISRRISETVQDRTKVHVTIND